MPNFNTKKIKQLNLSKNDSIIQMIMILAVMELNGLQRVNYLNLIKFG